MADTNLFIKKPQAIIKDSRLSSVEADYLCLIAGLQNANGCTASNAWFADYFGVTRQTAQEKIASLIAKNFLSRTEKKQGGKTVQRVLKIIDDDSRKLLLTDSRKSPVGLAGNSDIDSRKSPTLIRNIKLKENNIKKTFCQNSDEFRLAELLLNLILNNKPDFKKPDVQKWAKDIDLMIRLDSRKPERIEKVIRWSQQDSFWQSNILSVAKLRKQFDVLELRMSGQTKPIQSQTRPINQKAKRELERLRQEFNKDINRKENKAALSLPAGGQPKPPEVATAAEKEAIFAHFNQLKKSLGNENKSLRYGDYKTKKPRLR